LVSAADPFGQVDRIQFATAALAVKAKAANQLPDNRNGDGAN
jgi:hypothetical protein